MIPRGWKRKSLGEIADISSGSTPSRQKDKYWNGTIPWVTTGEIDYQIIESTKEKITELACKECSLKIHQSGTILMAMYGQGMTRGRIALLGLNATTNQACCAIRLDSSANTKFIYFQLEHLYPEIRKLGHGGNQQNLNGQIIKQISIMCPPLPEQCKIAEILGAWDEAIALLEKLITAKRKLKQGLMQQLLTGKKRFKEFEGSEWETVRLKEIAFVDQRSLRSNTPEDYTFRYISLSDINNGEISKNLPEICFAEAPSRARKLVSNNDIIMATVRPNLKAFSIIKSDADKYVVSTGFAVITTKKGYSPDYLYQYIFSDHIEQQINALVTGSNYPAINSSEIKQLSVYCSALAEQQKIASVLSAADTEISNLEKQLAAYKQQKRGLMQQLLTGKTRVRVN